MVYSPKLNNSLTITPTIAPLSSVQRPLEEVCSGDLIRGRRLRRREKHAGCRGKCCACRAKRFIQFPEAEAPERSS